MKKIIGLIVLFCGGILSAHAAEFRGVIHVHSQFSHDSRGTPERILKAADRAGLDFVMVTDHPPKNPETHPTRGLDGELNGLRRGPLSGRPILFIQGVETKRHLLAISLKRHVPLVSAEETATLIAKQNALPFIAHPEKAPQSLFLSEDVVGMEIFNAHYEALELKKNLLGAFGAITSVLLGSPQRVMDYLHRRPDAYLRKWDQVSAARFARGLKTVGISANDSHENIRGPYGKKVDTYERTFKFINTHIWAQDLSEGSVLSALREGQAFIAHNQWANSTGFEFKADPQDQNRLVVTLPKFKPRSGYKASVQWYLDGKRILRDHPSDGESVLLIPKQGGRRGVYRVEVTLSKNGIEKPWIYSNPIYLGL